MPLPADNRRVVIANCRPLIDNGRYAAKAAVGVPLQISADAMTDGHSRLVVWASWGRRVTGAHAAAARRGWQEVPLQQAADDRWSEWITPTQVGAAAYTLIACVDDYGSLLHELEGKFRARDSVEVELEEAALMIEARLRRSDIRAHDKRSLEKVREILRSPRAASARVTAATRATTVAVMRRTVDRTRGTVSGPHPLWVDRELGAFSSWYEMFPRSEGATATQSGNFETAARRLKGIAAMGFDIVYLPPIHPIGTSYRKGANNSLAAGPEDPGSPWAIGAHTGGHTDVHPDLGTIGDFDSFVADARRHDLEVGLDFAAQCSPDHPWVREHPQWFAHRPDGSIKYAENPPKKYQDIYPLNFNTADWRGLWRALRDVMLYWCGHGIRIFRVDNPHTKAFAFWEWAIAEIRRRYPETIFLSEAFTRRRVMEQLAKVGFTQSYTYFTWRNTKWEIEAYLRELSQPPFCDYFRPNFWPNTPDILPAALQHGGPGAFRLRLILAALCSGSWGMYGGYELYENVAVRADSEEYDHSEKYELRLRDWSRPDSLAPMISAVNAIRRKFKASITQMGTMHVHGIDSDQMVCVSRASHDGSEMLLIIVNLDPFSVHEATTWLDLRRLGIRDDRPYEAHDLLTDTTYVWHGRANYVRLDPASQPAHVLHLRER